jgi:ABC-type molybdate transport system substrate-binding protein
MTPVKICSYLLIRALFPRALYMASIVSTPKASDGSGRLGMTGWRWTANRSRLFLAAITLGLAVTAVRGEPSLVPVPAQKDDDLKLYLAGGQILSGLEALSRMQHDADVILWVAGNQFFAMDKVMEAFQAGSPGTKVGLITLPPGLSLQAIEAGGWRYGGVDVPGRPDIYGSVSLGHLQTLKQTGVLHTYMTYMHNELQIMVAEGNPKRLHGVDDLARPDVRTSMPNPISEGIMQFYARPMLVRHGLWQEISAGKECASCATTSRNWFTAVHHRETPARIVAGSSDAGIVWKTEVAEARRRGARVEGVELPGEDCLRDQVSYVAGRLEGSPRRAKAQEFLTFLSTSQAQAAYAGFGFVPATSDELVEKPVP